MPAMTREEFLKAKRELQAQIAEEKKAVQELSNQKNRYRETHKIEFFEPMKHQLKAIDFIKDNKKIVLVQGGNRSGKTVIGACIAGAFALGIFPWDKSPTPFGDVPVKIRIICEDWAKHAGEVIVPKLKEWLPVGTYRASKDNTGIESFWTFSNGSTIELMTNTQETRLHESWNGHLVWADEPTSRDKYIANLRGLIDFGGYFLLTMTAVTETWVLDDIARNTDPSVGCVTNIDMRENVHLEEADILRYEAMLTEDEKLTRIHGGWLNLAGLIWGNKLDLNRHVIDEVKVPRNWPVVVMIDWHTEKPHAVSYFAISPQNIWHLVYETWLNQSAEDLGDDIIRHKLGDDQWRIEQAFIDPLSKGDTSYAKRLGVQIEDSFTKLSTRLQQANIILDVASKDKDSGIKNVENMLRGPNGLPTLYFCRNIVNAIPREGTIWEIQRWKYVDGMPEKENDHFCENLYRSTLTGIKYTTPDGNFPEPTQSPYDPLTFGLGVAPLF